MTDTTAPQRIWATPDKDGDWLHGSCSDVLSDRKGAEYLRTDLVDELNAKARQAGWKACLDHLMQGGSQTGCDFVTADGKALGRFHGFFPAGAASDDKAVFYEELAKWERAIKHAKPISWADLDNPTSRDETAV